MSSKNYITAEEALNLSEHAIDRMLNSEEYTRMMNDIQDEIKAAAEEGATFVISENLTPLHIPVKYNETVFVKHIMQDWTERGFVVRLTESGTVCISW